MSVLPRRVGRTALALAGAVLMGAPLAWLLLAAFKSSPELAQSPPTLLPDRWVWDNIPRALEALGGRTFLNSCIFSLGVVSIQLALSMTTAFAIQKIRIRGGRALLLVFVATLLVPTQVTLVPQYIVVNQLDLVNTYAGLILPIAAATGFGVFLFHQHFYSIPDELIEAARMDGAPWWNIFLRIVVPLSKPAIAAYSAVTLLDAWNLYAWPLVAATDPDMQVLPVVLASLNNSQYSTTPLSVGLAQVVVTTLPLVIAFVFAERWFVQGIAGSGLKG